MGALLFSLLFAIQASKEYKIDALRFDGNKSFRDRRLAGVLVSKKGDPFSEAVLKYDLDILATFYSVQGFFGTKIDHRLERDTVRQRMRINIAIDEGERPRVEKVILTGIEEKEETALMGKVKAMEGAYLIDDKLNWSRLAVVNEIKEKGYPVAKVTTSFASETRYLVYAVERGPRAYFRETRITGLKRFRSRTVKREIKVRRGALYRQSKVVQSQRGIYRLGIFGYVDVATELAGVDSVDINFIVTETSPRMLNFGIGVQSPIRFLVSVGYLHLNMFNEGQVFSSDVSFAVNLEKEYDVKFEPRYTIPHIFGSSVYLLISPFIQYEDWKEFARITRGVEGKAIQFLGDNLQFNLTNRYKYVAIKEKNPDSLIPVSALTNSVIGNVIVDLRDDFFAPRRGFYFLPLVEDAGGVLGGDNHFYRLSAEVRLFQPLVHGIGAVRIRAGRIYPRREPLSLHEKFSLGGQLSIRGFDDKSIGPDYSLKEHYGNIMANANFEYRFDLYKSLGGLVFIDVGDVRNDMESFDWSELAKAVGVGLRLGTAIGPLRLDYGRGFGQGGGRFYFGLYHIF